MSGMGSDPRWLGVGLGAIALVLLGHPLRRGGMDDTVVDALVGIGLLLLVAAAALVGRRATR